MFASHPAKQALARLGAFAQQKPPVAKPVLDSALPPKDDKPAGVLS